MRLLEGQLAHNAVENNSATGHVGINKPQCQGEGPRVYGVPAAEQLGCWLGRRSHC